MKVVYIREEVDTCDFVRRLIVRIKNFFNIISKKEIGDKSFYYLPIFTSYNPSRFGLKRLASKVNKLLEKDETNIVVLSTYVSTITLFKNYLYNNNVDILSGKYLFKCMCFRIIEYILSEPSFEEITFLVNDLNKINKDIIEDVSKSVKRVHIVTNNIKHFNTLEKKLYSEFGIMINISNNKRRSLAKAGLILNLDFPEELINKYRINDSAVIVNLLNKINIACKRFNGINISSYKIKIPSEYKISEFSNEIVYESLIYKMYSFDEIKRKIINDKVSIDKLVGNNGIINKNNFKKTFKSIDKASEKE